MTRLYLSTNSANAANVSVFSATERGQALTNGDIVLQGAKPSYALDLDRGDYVIRADWANGAVSTHLVSIGSDTINLALDSDGDRSRPSPSPLAQERYVANTSSPSDFIFDVARASSRGYRGSDVFSSTDWNNRERRASLRDVTATVPISARSTVAELRAFIWDKTLHDWRLISQTDAPTLLNPDGNHETEDRFGFWVAAGERSLIQISKSEAPTRVVSFPGFKRPHHFFLSLRNAAGAPRVLPSISSRVDDPSLQALLDVLGNPGATNAQGLFGAAAEFDGAAQEYLRAKTEDSFAAAVGGYLLIRHRRLDLLRDWPNNLAERFSDLPDAPIIAAWQVLLSATDDHGGDAADKALQLFADALNRGWPIFEEGLTLLDTGLKFISRLVNPSADDLCGSLRKKLQPTLNARAPFGPFFGFIGEAPHNPGVSGVGSASPTFVVRLKTI